MPRPVHGESLLSWIDHVAGEFAMPRIEATAALGMDRPETNYYSLNKLHLGISAPMIAQIAARTGLRSDEIRAITLQDVRGIALDPGKEIRLKSWGPQRWQGWFRMTHSAACPTCLNSNGGRWLLRWRLPWMFLCETHRNFLIETCSCGIALQTIGRSIGDRCRARTDSAHRHRPGSECDVRARDLPAPAVADARLYALQRRLERVLDGWPSRGRARRDFIDLQYLTWLAAYAATPATLSHYRLDPAAHAAFAAAIQQRDRTMLDGGKTFWNLRDSVPSPPLSAAIVILAGRLVFTDDVAAAAAEFVEATRPVTNLDAARWNRFTTVWVGTPRLRQALLDAGAPLTPCSDRDAFTAIKHWKKLM